MIYTNKRARKDLINELKRWSIKLKNNCCLDRFGLYRPLPTLLSVDVGTKSKNCFAITQTFHPFPRLSDMSTTAAGATPVSVTNEREIQPMQLSLEQLNSLKTQHENELQELARQLEALVGARNRFGISKSTLLDMGSYSDNQKLLVPLNSSLYAPGKIVDSKKVG